jgi:hypothetical protein
MYCGRGVDMDGSCGSRAIGMICLAAAAKTTSKISTVIGGELAHAELMKHRLERARTGPG